MSEHERRFKKSLQNLHVPDWFSNSRFYRNSPGDAGRGSQLGRGQSTSSSSSSTFLTPNTPLAQPRSVAAASKDHFLSPGRISATLPAHAKPVSVGGSGRYSSASSAAARPDLTKSKSTDSHDTVPSDWTSKLSSSAAASVTSPPLAVSTCSSSSNPLSPMSPIYANLKAGSPYTHHRGLLSREISGKNGLGDGAN